MHLLDGKIIKVLLSKDNVTQTDLATILGAKPNAITHSLTRLRKTGLVDLVRNGAKQLPQLSLFRKLSELESVLTSMRRLQDGQ